MSVDPGAPAPRRAQRVAAHGWRRVTADRRALPDFVVLGAQKAGTTSLYGYLRAHQQVLAALPKAVHYFDLNYARGERWYRAMFPRRSEIAARAAETGRAVVTGEATPYYLFHPLAPERAAGCIPNARFIVMLRDPVERAWSHYRHEVAVGHEKLDFEQALDAEPERLRDGLRAIVAGEDGPAADEHRNFSYAARGQYAAQLRSWFAHFPREQFYIGRAEDLFADPAAEFRAITSFLGLEMSRAGSFPVLNARHDPGLDPRLRARLVEDFAGSNAELEELLERKFDWPVCAT